MAAKIRGDAGCIAAFRRRACGDSSGRRAITLPISAATCRRSRSRRPAASRRQRAESGFHRSNSHDAQEGISNDQNAESVGTTLLHRRRRRQRRKTTAEASTDELSSRKDPNAPRGFSGDVRLSGEMFSQSARRRCLRRPSGRDLVRRMGRRCRSNTSRAASLCESYTPIEGDERWVDRRAPRHPALVRTGAPPVRASARTSDVLNRQRAGDDLDIAACVSAIVDRRIGHTPDDRLYLDARPARRGTADFASRRYERIDRSARDDGVAHYRSRADRASARRRSSRRAGRSLFDSRVLGQE